MPSNAVVFTNGCFDVALHMGHAQFLRRCRELGSKLIVGLNTDESVRRLGMIRGHSTLWAGPGKAMTPRKEKPPGTVLLETEFGKGDKSN